MRDEQKECMTKGRNVWQNPKNVYVGGLRILVILRLCISIRSITLEAQPTNA